MEQQMSIRRALDDHDLGVAPMTAEARAAALEQLDDLQADADRQVQAQRQQHGDSARAELHRRVVAYTAAVTAAADAFVSMAGMEMAIREAGGSADARVALAVFSVPLPGPTIERITFSTLAASIAAEASAVRRSGLA